MKKLTTKFLAVACGCLMSMGASAQTYHAITVDTLIYTTLANLKTLSWIQNQNEAGNDFNAKTGQSVTINPETDENDLSGKIDGINVKSNDQKTIHIYITSCDSVTFYIKATSTSRTLTAAATPSDGSDVVTYTTPNFESSGCLRFALKLDASKEYDIKLTATNDIMWYAVKLQAGVVAPSIKSFTAAGVEATIDQAAKTITAELPYGTDLTSLNPIVVMGGAKSYSPEGAQNFSSAVIYTVCPETPYNAEAAGNVSYTVNLTAKATASSEKDLTNVTINGMAVTLNENAGSLVVSKATDLSAMTVTVTFDIPVTATANFISGNTHNFSNALVITVTAQDGSQANYTLNVTKGTKDIAYVVTGSSVSANDTKIYPAIAAKGYYMELIDAAVSSITATNYDLVILSEKPDSKTALALELGNIIGTVPFLNFKGYMFGKTNWPAGAGVQPKATTAKVQNGYMGHPIFAGVTMSDSIITMLSTLSGNGIQAVSGSSHNILANSGETTNAAILEYNNDSPVNKMITICISNDDYANVTADALKLIDNALTYVLDNTARFVPGTTPTHLGNITIEGINFTNGIVRNANGVALQVYNANGKLIAAGTSDIDMNVHPVGMYIVRSAEGAMKIVK